MRPRWAWLFTAALGCDHAKSASPGTLSAPPPDASFAPLALSASAQRDAGREVWTELFDGSLICAEFGVRDDRLSFVTVADEGWRLETIPRSGETHEVLGLSTATATSEACDVVDDGTHVYVVSAGVTLPSGREGSAHRFDRVSGRHEELLLSKYSLRKLAQDERSVYTLRLGAPTGDVDVLRIDKRSKKTSTLATLRARNAFSLALTDDAVLIGTCDQGELGRLGQLEATLEEVELAAKSACAIEAIPKKKGPTRVVISKIGAPMDLRVEGADVYFVDGSSGNVGRVPVAGGPATILARDQGATWSVAADGEWVFFTVNDAGELRAVKKDGTGGVRVLASGLDGVHAVRVQHDSLVVRTRVSGGKYEVHVVYDTPLSGRGSRLLRAPIRALLEP